MRRQILIGLIGAVCLFSHTAVNASDRGFVISKITTEYYSEDFLSTIEELRKIDINSEDDIYFKQVFDCLDDYSAYYTAEELHEQRVPDEYEMISASFSEGVAVIKIDRFATGVDEKFSEYMSRCREENIKELVLDLTGCPGGYISVMNNIANHIMPKGIVLTAKFKNEEKIYYSELEECPFDEIFVRVSAQTASAAEILAAGLQEAGVAVVSGVNTYGKTSIQSFYTLESGGAFKLTCGEYLTRNGTDISETGVVPDIFDYSYSENIGWNDLTGQRMTSFIWLPKAAGMAYDAENYFVGPKLSPKNLKTRN